MLKCNHDRQPATGLVVSSQIFTAGTSSTASGSCPSLRPHYIVLVRRARLYESCSSNILVYPKRLLTTRSCMKRACQPGAGGVGDLVL